MDMVNDFKIAIISVWLILSAIMLAGLVALYALPVSALLSVSSTLQGSHSQLAPCALCGMTRAFVSIAHWNFEQATRLHPWSIALYMSILVNVVAAIIYAVRIVVHGKSANEG